MNRVFVGREHLLASCRTAVHMQYAELLQSDVDSVYICTATGTHSKLVLEALNAGKHVLCEKPAMMSSDQVQQARMIAEQSGLQFEVMFQPYFIPQWKDMVTAIEEGQETRIRYTMPLEGIYGFEKVLTDIGFYPAMAVVAGGMEVRGTLRVKSWDNTYALLSKDGGELEVMISDDFTYNQYVRVDGKLFMKPFSPDPGRLECYELAVRSFEGGEYPVEIWDWTLGAHRMLEDWREGHVELE